MGFFDDIKARIFGAPAPAANAAVSNPPPATAPAEKPVAAAPAAAPAQAAASPAPAPAAASAQPVDVAAILDAAVAASGQTLNWKTSIVDLMKALDLDSSLTARKQLADELGYTGDKSDSASMNVWLHKQVLSQLAANGGKVPQSLLG
ncbi:DUF3597 domain-containing protein [Devosia sp.]|uniref:DUF3597 domain-containing protein n=1 Tax=Devosia sp. TaxID=1871048 RepID=UPI002AFE3742|nr:DUF3597 domain-containing protein [Devosia sp.]